PRSALSGAARPHPRRRRGTRDPHELSLYWSRDGDAGGVELTQGAVAVARLQVDGADALREHNRGEPEPHGVEAGLPHAIVGRDAEDHDALDIAAAQQRLQPGAAHLTRRQMLHAERGIAVLGSGGLADELTVDVEFVREVRSPRVVHAMHRPDTAEGLEV